MRSSAASLTMPSTTPRRWRSRIARSFAVVPLWVALAAAPALGATAATPYLHYAVAPPSPDCTEPSGRWAERTASAAVGPEGDAGGDMNADGVNDLWVAQPQCDLTFSNQGRVQLLSGQALRTGGATVLRTIEAPTPQQDAKFGFFIAVLGDVNSDGTADIAVGTDAQDVGANVDQGKAWVFSGATGAQLYALDNPVPQGSARFGSRIGRAGDVNANGTPDVIVGASNNDVSGRADQGQAFIFEGSTGALIRTLNQPTADQVAGGNFGIAVQGPGDVDGDGRADQLVAATNFVGGLPSQGRMYAFSGASGALIRTIDDPVAQSSALFGFQDAAPLSPGDLSGDARSELYGNGFQQDRTQVDEGQAWVFDGATGASRFTLTDPSPEFGGQFGWSMSKTDYDHQANATNDLYVGQSPHHTPGASGTGGTYVFSGTTGALLKALELPTACAQASTSTNLGPNLGWTVSTPGDLDLDGEPDYVAGAPFFDRGANQDEGVLLVFMSNEQPNPSKPC